MPIYCEEMKLPDRNEIVDILNEIERILFPAYFGVNSLKGMTASEYVEKTLGESVSYPATFVIKKGEVIAKKEGSMQYYSLYDFIKENLK